MQYAACEIGGDAVMPSANVARIWFSFDEHASVWCMLGCVSVDLEICRMGSIVRVIAAGFAAWRDRMSLHRGMSTKR